MSIYNLFVEKNIIELWNIKYTQVLLRKNQKKSTTSRVDFNLLFVIERITIAINRDEFDILYSLGHTKRGFCVLD